MVFIYVGITVLVCVLTVVVVKHNRKDTRVSMWNGSYYSKNKLIDSTNNEFSISALQSGRSIREHVTFQISLDKGIAIDNIKDANDLKIDFGYSDPEIDVLLSQLEQDFQIKPGKLLRTNVVYVEDLVNGLQKYAQSPCECYFKEGHYNRCEHNEWLHMPNLCVAIMGFHKSGDSTLIKALMKFACPGTANHCKNSDDTLFQFASNHSHYTLIDVPGSTCNLNETIAGMALCDTGIFVVSVSDDKIDREVMDRDDSIRLRIARSMGVKRLVVFVNKVDLKSDYTYLKKVEKHIREKIKKFGYDAISTPVIFGSAKKALYEKNHRYGKKSILELIRKMDWYFNPVIKELKAYRAYPFRLIISRIDSLMGESEGVIASGVVKVGDTVNVFCGSCVNQQAKVRSISIFESHVKAAYPGDFVKLNLDFKSSVVPDDVVSICDVVQRNTDVGVLILKFHPDPKKQSFLKKNKTNNSKFSIFISGVEMKGAVRLKNDAYFNQEKMISFYLSNPILRLDDNSTFIAVLNNELIGHGVVASQRAFSPNLTVGGGDE